MKITSLLSQFLYNHHRLDLPGIGTFLLDPSALSGLENSKQKSAVLDGISFENNPGLRESPELVAYISAQTGKMKPLAAADLESYLEVAQQFLNIGKPFTFEGIGTLVKLSLKECEFIPIAVSPEKLKELSPKDSPRTPAREEAPPSYEPFLGEPSVRQNWKKPVIAIALICGLGLTIWGGYLISKRTAGAGSNESNTVSESLATDSLQSQPSLSDTTVKEPTTGAADDNYKFVLEEASKQRAFKRYNQLRTNLWDVKLETQDSVRYKLYLLLPAATYADTTHVMDSLTVMTGRKVHIEYPD